MDEAQSQPWYELCRLAVTELDAKRLSERVDAAEAAIHGRLRDLQDDSDHHEERQRIEDAKSTLAFLRRETTRLYAEDSTHVAPALH
jgi:hypothetical protein